MTRKLILLAVFAVAVGGTAVAGDDPPAADKKDDAKATRGKLFSMMDADSDGKVTKDEFKAWADKLKERLKDKGRGEKLGDALGDKFFDKLDANADGAISKDEFDKFEVPDRLKGKLDLDKLKKRKDK